VHQSTEHFHSSVEQTEQPEAEDEIFIVGLAARLNQLVITGAAKHLIMVAPARVLRLIRKRSSAAVKSVIYAELARDLTQWPIDEIGNVLWYCE
jgi:protein required for attachment to host cells